MAQQHDNERWHEGKQRHLALSAAAAAQYDESYGSANFATKSYMDYEIAQLDVATDECYEKSIAFDLGCGTGRDSFHLAKSFGQVYAWDFSQEMIDVANVNKLAAQAGNVAFEVADIEDGLPQVEDNYADLVNSAFGMGSFVPSLDELCRTLRRLLKPGGIAVLSLYNASALVNKLDLSWRPALAARLQSQGTLRVIVDGTEFDIAAKAYDVDEARHVLASYFESVRLTTFPTLTALLPQDVLDHREARRLCRTVDQSLAGDVSVAAGPYIVAIARTPGRPPSPYVSTGYDRVMQILRFHSVEPQLHEHAPLRDTADALRHFSWLSPDRLLKSILVVCRREPARSESFYCFVLPATARLDFAKVARLLNVGRDSVRMASPLEVEERTGFTVGAVAPLGMPNLVPVCFDDTVPSDGTVVCGTGKSTESFEIDVSLLKRLCTASDMNVAKAS